MFFDDLFLGIGWLGSKFYIVLQMMFMMAWSVLGSPKSNSSTIPVNLSKFLMLSLCFCELSSLFIRISRLIYRAKPPCFFTLTRFDRRFVFSLRLLLMVPPRFRIYSTLSQGLVTSTLSLSMCGRTFCRSFMLVSSSRRVASVLLDTTACFLPVEFAELDRLN